MIMDDVNEPSTTVECTNRNARGSALRASGQLLAPEGDKEEVPEVLLSNRTLHSRKAREGDPNCKDILLALRNYGVQGPSILCSEISNIGGKEGVIPQSRLTR